MSGWEHFEGRIIPMEWGRNTYTILRLPDDVAARFEEQGVRRVEGEFDDVPVNLALTKAPVIDGIFVYAGKSLLEQTGLEAGEVFDVRLRAADPDHVEIPEDVTLALRQAGKTGLWEALSPGKRRGLLHPIGTAKRAETRSKRIAALIAELK